MVTRAALYTRVSSDDQVLGYSLGQQQSACESLCATRGYELAHVYTDAGTSAYTDVLAKRPAFSDMLRDAEAGQFDVLVVHKMDRFSRRLRITLECLERLGRARVGVVSVSEPNLDYSTPQGFLFLSMLGALAEWYSRNLSAETKKGWAGRKRAGLWAGRLPFGVRKGDDGIPEPDPDTYSGLTLAFERSAAGATDLEVARALNSAGYRPVSTAPHAIFSRDSARTILQNRFYVGELPIGKRGKLGWLPAKHVPLVDRELFDRVEKLRQERALHHRAYHPPAGRTVHALTGLVVCGLCGEPMQQDGRAKRLSCRARRQGRGCEAKSVVEWIIEEELAAYLGRLTIPDDAHARILAAYGAKKPEIAADEVRRRQIETQLKRLTDVYVLGDLALPEYEQRRATLRAELASLAVPESHGQPAALAAFRDYLERAGSAWLMASPEQRNKLARELFASVTVREQRLVSVQPRPEYAPYFALAGMKEAGASHEYPGFLIERARGVVNPDYQDWFDLNSVTVSE